MQLRYYQIEAIEALYKFFEEHPHDPSKLGQWQANPVVAMPTGTGKGVVIGSFIRNVFENYPGQRVLMLTHVQELIEQNFAKLLEVWPTVPAGIYSAGLGRRDLAPVVFAGIDSVYRKPEIFGHVDLIIVDECDLVAPNDETKYMKFMLALLAVNPLLKVIGLSATCWRMGMGKIIEGGVFTDFAYDITSREKFNKLISEGYLAPLVPKKTDTELDVTGVHTVAGEYNQNELQEAVDREPVTYYALTELVHWAQTTHRKSWLIFTTGIKHTEHVTQMLQEKFNIPARAVHSRIGKQERRAALEAFKRGDIPCLVNNNILTTGFDHPYIDLIGVLRPTQSARLWVQMLGRGTRPAPGKDNCLVLDFAGNTKRLGPINDPKIPKKKGKRTKPGEAPVRLCEACMTYNHASARFCEFCGAEFGTAVNISETADDKPLIAGDIDVPITEVFTVDRITYARHQKNERPDSLKVSYYCGLRFFQEWVCLEHVGAGYGRALHNAHEWWKLRCTLIPPPPSVTVALANVNILRTPTHIRVWTNTKHPEIKDHAFEGVFTHAKSDSRPAPPPQAGPAGSPGNAGASGSAGQVLRPRSPLH